MINKNFSQTNPSFKVVYPFNNEQIEDDYHQSSISLLNGSLKILQKPPLWKFCQSQPLHDTQSALKDGSNILKLKEYPIELFSLLKERNLFEATVTNQIVFSHPVYLEIIFLFSVFPFLDMIIQVGII